MQRIADVMQSIKGESAYWFNRDEELNMAGRLIWQDDYFVVSVSEAHLGKVQEYIQRQEEHHQHTTYYQEVKRMSEKYGFALQKETAG